LERVKDQEILLEKVFLLPTDTLDSRACADQIKRIILDAVFQSRLISKSTVKLGENARDISICSFDLNVRDERNFSQDAASFMAMIENKLVELDAAGIQHRVFNITGGYKVLVSMFSLFGFLRDDVEIIYKHEDAEKLITIPSLPLSWDFKLFDEYRSLVHEGRESLDFEPPSKLEALFQREGSSWRKNAFGTILEGIYDQDKFKRFGSGARLMQYLNPQLQQELEGHISRWEHIWIGDQIPETVEHSRGHSTRLLEYASDLLEPYIQSNPEFLKDEELYLFICCLWLHDVGHTALTYDFEQENSDTVTIPVAMFPTLVRRWHSLLSYKLIRTDDYLCPGERDAVALISKYHRGKFPLTSSQNTYQDEQFPIAVGPMAEQLDMPLRFRGNNLVADKVLLIAALLKVIDGCDVQSDRIINESYWKMRTARTKVEVDYLFHIIENRLELLDFCNCCSKSQIERLRGLLGCCREKWDAVSTSEPEARWGEAEKVEKFVDGKIEGPLFAAVAGICFQENFDGTEREILLEQLSLIDRAAFKMRQEAHFYKHSRVKLVYLTGQNQRYQFNMTFDQAVKLSDQQKVELAKGLWKEYTAVKKVIEGNGIQFEGVFSRGNKIYPLDGGQL